MSPDGCPFQKGKLCTARPARPLGCRVYYCDPSYQETGSRLTEDYLRRLKKLAQEYNLDWQYAPLYTFLNQQRSAISGQRSAVRICPRSPSPLGVEGLG